MQHIINSNNNYPILVEIIVLFILGITSVLPTLWGIFIFDDGEAIIKNEDIISPDRINVSQIFKHDFWGVSIIHPQSHKSYRPLTTLTYRLDYYLWGENPFPFHLINLIIHGWNCCLVYFFLRKCVSKYPKHSYVINGETITVCKGGQSAEMWINKNIRTIITNDDSPYKNKMCFWASILFAVHPIHVEPLGSVVGRADLISSFIFLSSFLMISKIPSLTTSIQLLLAGVIGSLFKENCIVILIFYIGIHLMKQKSFKNVIMNHVYFHGLTVALGALFIFWRLWFQNGPPVFQPYDNPAVFSENLFTKISSTLYIWILNAFLLICPIWLCYDWSMGCISLIESPFDIRFFLVVVLAIIGLLYIYKAFKSRIILISLIISATTFLPSSNLLFTVGFVIAERNLYLVSIGFCLLIAHTIIGNKKLNFLRFIVIIFFVRSYQRSVQWTSQDKLFNAGLEVCPNNAKIHYNLGTIYGDAGNVSWAVQSYEKAIELRSDYYQSMNNLGNILRTNGRNEEAEMWLRRAVITKDDFAPAWMNLGIVLSQKNKTEALYCYQRALQLRKYYPDCEYNLGNLYLEMNDTKSALLCWKKATVLKPTHNQAWINIVVLLDQQEKLIEAREWGFNGSKFLPKDDTLQFLQGNIAGKLKKYEKAKQHFENAIQLCKEHKKLIPAKYWSNFGVLYHRWGKKSEAIACYEEALKLDSTLDSTRKNLAMLKL